MVASLQGSVGKGTKKDESSTGHVWAAVFHHVKGLFSLGACFETYEPFISLIVQIFFRQQQTTDTGVRLYSRLYLCTQVY